eukprot:TCONS_00025522-protein
MIHVNEEPQVPLYSNIKFVDGYQVTMDALGKSYLMSDTPLSSGNHGKLFHLFGEEKQTQNLRETTLIRLAGGVFKSTKPVLSTEQCEEMVARLENVNKEFSLTNEEKSPTITSVIYDKQFADTVWESLRTDFVRQNQKPAMLGFDVQRGSWELEGLHHGLTFHRHSNRYSKPNQLDAQFCPTHDRRSLYTCLIFLSDELNGGEVEFTILLQSEDDAINRKNETIKTLIKKYENTGLLRTISYKPKSGDVIFFKQDIIYKHKDLAKDTDHSKYFLKCDLMFERREAEQFQYFIPEEESRAYEACARNAHVIMREEFNDHYRSLRDEGKYYINDDDYDYPDEERMRELLEHILNETYCYPKKSKSQDDIDSQGVGSLSEDKNRKVSSVDSEILDDSLSRACVNSSTFPCEVWMEIIKKLKVKDCRNLIKVFPDLEDTYHRMLKTSVIVPELIHHNGVTTEFIFKRCNLIEDNPEKMALVSTVYSIMLLGNSNREKDYLIMFDRDQKQAEEITLEEILHCLFTDGELPDGDLFVVTQQDVDVKQPIRDLFYSVDRRFMTQYYRMNFFGVDVNAEKKCSFEITKEYDNARKTHIMFDQYRHNERIESTLEKLTGWDRTFRLYRDNKNREEESLEKFQYQFEPGLTSQETLNGISRFLPYPDSSEKDEENTYLFELVERERNWRLADYPSALIVRKLDKPASVNREDYVDEQISWKLSNNCTTHVFNRFILNNDKLDHFKIDEDYEYVENSDDDDEDGEEYKWEKYDGSSLCIIMRDNCLNRKLMMERVEMRYKELKGKFYVDSFIVKLRGCGSEKCKGSIDLQRHPLSLDPKWISRPYDFTVNEYTDIVAFPLIGHMHLTYVKEENIIRFFTTYGNLIAF